MPTIKAVHPTASFEYDGNSIVKIILRDDDELTMQDIMDHREIVDHMVNGHAYCMLVITGERTRATEEGRTFAARNLPAGRLAEAIIIRSLPVRIMGNFYLKFHKPGIPTRLFDDEESAMKWLREVLKGYERSRATTA